MAEGYPPGTGTTNPITPPQPTPPARRMRRGPLAGCGCLLTLILILLIAWVVMSFIPELAPAPPLPITSLLGAA